MKTREQIIERIREGIPRGIDKFYFNALLFVLERTDLIPKTYTYKRMMKILEELESHKTRGRWKS